MEIINLISKNKFRLSRGYSYIALFSMPILVVDVINRRFPEIKFLPLFIASIFGIWLIGMIDDKLGLLNGEQSYSTLRNKLLMDGLYRVKKK